jgi:tetratricopeptide (TPR) repeat protein
MAGILISIILLPLLAMASNSPALEEGMKLYYAKDWEKAKLSFEQALAIEPVDSLSLSYYYTCFLWTDSVTFVVSKTEQDYVQNPGKTENLVRLGFAYYAMSQIDSTMQEEAKDQFRELLTLEPKSSIAHTGLGILYDSKRMTPRAKAEFIKALELNPNDILALEHIGIIIMLDELNPSGSLQYFQKVVTIVPSYPDSYFYIGSAYYKMGKYDEALPYLKKSMELDPLGIGRGYFSPLLMGDIYMNLKKYDDAVTVYNKALEINPDNIAARAKLDKAIKAKEGNGK